MHHLEVAKVQARSSNFLTAHRLRRTSNPPNSPKRRFPIPTKNFCPRRKRRTRKLPLREKMVEKQKLQVDLAHKDFYPDFNVQYMWQRTDPTQFRAYYMFTFGVRVPIYRGRKQRPELAQAEAELSRSRSESEAQSQQVASEFRSEYETAQKTAELLKIYREGLLPQARANFKQVSRPTKTNARTFRLC